MSKNRLLSGVAASAIAVAGLAAVALPASAAQHADSTTIHTTVAGNGWVVNSQGPGNGSITGAIAPGGRDAAELTTQGDGTIMTLFGTSYIGTKFADISGLSYSTYVANSEQDILAPSIGVEIWGGTTNAFLGSMVYEPYRQQDGSSVVDGQWQTWDTMSSNALWWSSKAVTDSNGNIVIPAQATEPLSVFEAAWAANPNKYSNINTKDGVKTYVGSSAPSSGWNNFVGYVDDVVVTTGGANPSDTDWDFTTGIGACAATVDNATETDTLTQDCTTASTITVPDGWTIDGAGHTLTAVENAASPNFPGPVLLSTEGSAQAATMNVANLHITTSGFGNGNSGGQLAGIKYDRAGGSLENVSINGISHGNGVQEGIGLWVRNRDASGSYAVPPATVSIDNVTVTNYQKAGMVLDGNLGFTLTNSTIGAAAGPDGTPLTSIAANSLQVSRAAHGTVSGNHIALNEYNPQPPPGDGSDATAVLVYDAKTVTLTDNVISGDNGDVAIDTYNDTLGVLDTHVIASCNLISRDEQPGDPSDPYGVGVAQWNDGSTPVEVDLSDTTFTGWAYNTSTITPQSDGSLSFGGGATDQSLGQCPPSAPTGVMAPGGDGQTDVSWNASTAPEYAPLTGYTVTAKDSGGNVVATQDVDANTTSTHLAGLADGQDYTISVVANGGGGTSAPGTVVLHSTSLLLSAADSQVTYGSGTTLNGTLTSTGGSTTGRTVTIQSAPSGTGSWSTLGTVTVGAGGSFSKAITPTDNTDYRAVYSGDPDLASTSTTTTVEVAMAVKDRASAKKVKSGGKVLFSGAVTPSNVGGTVELQQKVHGVWTIIQTHQLDAQSSFGFRWTAGDAGKYQFRVLAVGDGTHVDGVSKIAKVTVK